MKTRTKKSAVGSAEDTETTKSTTQAARLAPDASNPPQLLILPKSVSKHARIVTLPNPRRASASRYVVCPECGIYEFTKVSAPRTTPRSWLLSAPRSQNGDVQKPEDPAMTSQETAVSDGYVTKSADILVATLVDPVFFVLPALIPSQSARGSTERRLFLSSEDYFDRMGADSNTLKSLLRSRGLRELLETRMAAVCDTVEAGDETMYRVNEKRLLEEIMMKAKRMIENELPASMEEKFIKKPLEAPMLSIQRDESFHHQLAKEEEAVTPAKSGTSTPTTEAADSQSSALTIATSFSDASTAATSFTSDPPKMDTSLTDTGATPAGVAELLRLRTAFLYVCSSYLPHHITTILKALLVETSPNLFAPLDNQLAHISKLRQEAVAARSLGDMSRKRSMLDDEEEEARAEKKRKKEEDEKRKKAGESRGVKNLKKVNTTGMKKMSAFFIKKA